MTTVVRAQRFETRTILVAIAVGITAIGACGADSLSTTPWARRHWQLAFDSDPEGLIGVARWELGPLVACSRRGLFTFDGRRTRHLACAVPAGDAFARGGLTIGTEANRALVFLPLHSGSLIVFDGETTTLVPSAATRSGTAGDTADGRIPTSAAWSPQSGFWMAHRDGSVSRYHGGRLATIVGPVADSDRTFGDANVVVDGRGRLWAARAGELLVWDEHRFEEQAALPRGEALLAASGNRGIWIKNHSILLHYDVQLDRLDRRDETMVGTATGMIEDRHGRLWIATSRFGLHVWHNGETTTVPGDARWVKALHEDDEGTIWTGSPLGLDSYRDAMVSATALADGPLVSDLEQDGRDHIWFLTPNGRVGRYLDPPAPQTTGDQENRPIEYLDLSTMTTEPAAAIAGSADGIWIGTRDGRLFHHAVGQTREVSLPRRAVGQPIHAMMASHDGRLWLGIGSHLFCRRPDEQPPEDEPIIRLRDGDSVAYILEHPSGVFWAATHAGKIVRVRGHDARQAASPVDVASFALPVGLPAGSEITAICPANHGGLWCAVRSSGLWRFHEGHWSAIDGRHKLPSTLLTGLVRDRRGLLWCGSDGGLFIVDTSELEAVADGLIPGIHGWRFPAGDDTEFLRETTSPRAATLLAKDGRVFFSLRSGVATGHPEAIPTAGTLPLGVQQIRVAGTPVAHANPLEAGETSFPPYITLPAWPRDIRIDYAVNSFVAPTNSTVSHQLVGLDRDWIEGVPPFSASYAELPPGRYEFRLRSSDHHGKPLTHTGFVCEVPPALWEQGWFRGAAAFLLAGCGAFVIAGLQALQSRHRMSRLRHQAAIDQERMRIARDMHDDVGTSLNQIALLAEVARQQSEPGVRERLDTVVAIARRTMAAFDELVWAVNPENDSLPHLLSYVSHHATEVLNQFGIQTTIVMAPVFPEIPISADVRHAILMIVKESIGNIIAHAGATGVEIKTDCRDNRLTITLSDNGRGIGSEASHAGLGLRNMQARAEQIGGTCQIETLAAGGTAVRLELDLS